MRGLLLLYLGLRVFSGPSTGDAGVTVPRFFMELILLVAGGW